MNLLQQLRMVYNFTTCFFKYLKLKLGFSKFRKHSESQVHLSALRLYSQSLKLDALCIF